MKKAFAVIFLIFFVLSGCSINDSGGVNAPKQQKKEYVRAIWITYYELEEMIKPTQEDFSAAVESAFEELENIGFNTVTVQVRPCADAFYRSKYFPSSKYCFSSEGADMPYDPLEIMCAAADKYNLKIEAWINPYRVSQQGNIKKLSDSNKAKKWYFSKSKKSNVYITDGKIYFNPASDDVTELIVNGVREIVRNYDIDGIHFDDYFYPTTDSEIDSAQYCEYKKSGGDMKLADWRRSIVGNMIKKVYKAVKKENSDVLFGVSPSADIDTDYSELYADVTEWCSNDGYLDYICPQIYYGFKNESMPFMQTAKKWCKLSEKTLFVGLPLYKSGKKDKYASADDSSAINEFIKNKNTIARQITYVSKLSKVSGFYIFSYGCLDDEKCSEEVKNILSVLK